MSSISYESHMARLSGRTETPEPAPVVDAGPTIMLLDELINTKAVRTLAHLNGLEAKAWNSMHTMVHFDPGTYDPAEESADSLRVIHTNATGATTEPFREDRILRAYNFTDGPAFKQQLAIDALLSAHTNRLVEAVELPSVDEDVTFDQYALSIGNLIPAIDRTEKKARTGAARYGRAKNEQRRRHYVGSSMGATIMLRLAAAQAEAGSGIDVASVAALAPVYKEVSDLEMLPVSLEAQAISSGFATTTTTLSPEQANIVFTGPHTNFRRLEKAIEKQQEASAAENAGKDTWGISGTLFNSVLESGSSLVDDVQLLADNGTNVNLGVFRSDQVTAPYDLEELMESMLANVTRYIGRGTGHTTSFNPYVLMNTVEALVR